MNGGKYDSLALKNQLVCGAKAVNALSNYFRVESVRDDTKKAAEFSAGNLFLKRLLIQQKERN
jgi:topoisomerase-4 subunit B